MTGPAFRFEPLDAQDRGGFSCGVEALDRYFRAQVSQDTRKRVATCYIAIENATDRIAGFYTLSASDVLLQDLATGISKRLPRYPRVPVVRIGRLGVDTRFKGRRVGTSLVLDAAVRTARSEVGAYALVVDAKDERAEAFYRRLGFQGYGANPRQMIAPIASFRALIGD